MRPSTPRAWSAIASSFTAAASAQVAHPEAEPNDFKGQAMPVTLAPGDTITGSTTGADGSGSGALSSADYFLVTTPGRPRGIYRNRLILSGPAALTATIRGLQQSNGTILNIEAGLQTALAATTPPRFNQWYSFGRPEKVYYRITGSAATTDPYTATYQTSEVTPIALGPFPPGNLAITTVGQTGGTQTDTDLWVYDGLLQAIPGWGNDDSGVSSGSTLARPFTTGVYYLAISTFNVANNLPSPADDAFRLGPVLDFPDAALDSIETAANVSFRVTDSLGAEHFVSASKSGPYEIAWFQIAIRDTTVCYANCDGSTSPPALNVGDFTCFLQAYAIGDPYANCDHSTIAPVINAGDFTCFLQKYAIGCS